MVAGSSDVLYLDSSHAVFHRIAKIQVSPASWTAWRRDEFITSVVLGMYFTVGGRAFLVEVFQSVQQANGATHFCVI
jgi:hypothetical protein